MANADIWIGVTLLVFALGLMTWLVAWSRRTINRIAREDLRSVRDIVRKLGHG